MRGCHGYREKKSRELQEAARSLRRDGVVIYPTETLFAIGCSALSGEGAFRVASCKGRDADKPLPLLVGREEQLEMVLAGGYEQLEPLAKAFWPGPLSVLLPGRADLPREVKNREGLVSIRLSPHPTAQALCGLSGLPLVATSANTSGMPAVRRSGDLGPELVRSADQVVLQGEEEASGTPSTLVRPLGSGWMRILREGAVTRKSLEKAGFRVKLG